MPSTGKWLSLDKKAGLWSRPSHHDEWDHGVGHAREGMDGDVFHWRQSFLYKKDRLFPFQAVNGKGQFSQAVHGE